MKKGFTLIELLAVIVVLAIIALIATPIVLNIINEVNESSNIVSFQNLERSVKLYYSSNGIEENVAFECSDGVCKNGEDILDINGVSPSQGKILIDKNGNITYEELIINGYNCYKEHDKPVCSKDKIRKTFNENSIVINTEKEYSLLDYNIYGNIDEVGDRTKNLISVNSYKLEGVSLNKTIFSGELQLPAVLTWDIDYTSNNQAALFELIVDGASKYVRADQKEFNITGNALTSIKILNWPQDIGNVINIQLEQGITATEYEPHGKYKIPVKVVGKNLIKYPYQNNSINSNGIKFVDNLDGTITVSGTATSNAIFNIEDDRNNVWSGMSLDKTYTASLSYEGNYISSGVSLVINYYPKNAKEYLAWLNVRLGHSKNNIPPSDIFGIRSYILILSGTTVDNLILKPQLEYSQNATEYEPYNGLPVNIYLDEPLRCVDEICDYVDFKNQKVVRYVEKLEDGILSILKTPKEESIELTEILLNKGVNNISVETSVSPSKIELEYYK